MGKNLILMLIVIVVAWRALKKDYIKGVAVCVAFFISLPDYLRISVGGGIPELTIHRILLILLAFYWRSTTAKYRPFPRVPFLGGMTAFIAAQGISMLLSINLMGSVKSMFVYTLEVGLLFYMVSTSMQSTEDIKRVLRAVAFGLGSVAIIAWIERRWEINWSKQIVFGDGTATDDIVATYPHRILLGYAMAMGVPIIFAATEVEQQKRTKRILWVLLLLAMAGCYFSNSRGPWSGLIVGGVLLFFFGTKYVKKAAAVVAMLGIVAIIARPGIRETLGSALFSTFQEKDSIKANSYAYRWRLWYVAWSEIKQSPERLLFGYGGLSTEGMDLSHYFDKEAGGNTVLLGWTSWDNQFACDLIEFGVVGFSIEVCLFLLIVWKLIGMRQQCPRSEWTLTAAFLSACVTYSYAMTNVYIFAPQVKCLFWVLVACGTQYGRLRQLELAAAKPAPAGPVTGRRPTVGRPPRPSAFPASS